MKQGISRGVKYLFIAISFCFFCEEGYAQTDVVTISKIKDFINAGLTRAILSSDSLKKDSSAKYLPGVDSVLQKNTPENPVYYAAMQKLLEGKFDSVTKKFSSKVDQIDVRAYQQYNYEQAGKLIYDSAFAILRQYSAFAFAPTVKDSMYLALTKPIILVPSPSMQDTLPKVAVKKVSEPIQYVPWYGRFSGFVFWLLVCVLISVALFLYCLDQIRQLKSKLTDTEKHVVHLEEEKEHDVSNHGQVTTIYTEFRNLVTLKIKELYDVVDHLNQRIIQLQTAHLPPIAKENIERDRSEESEHIFYMSVPLPGHFPFSARALKKDALYKFTMNSKEREAHFEVINDGILLTEVLADLPKFFEPACTMENELLGEVRVIITKNPGTAQFDGEKWVIQQKASIIFI